MRLLLATLLAVTPTAVAEPLPLGVPAKDVLLICNGSHVGGIGASCGTGGMYWGKFAQAHKAAGITLDVLPAMPEDLSHYRTVWIAYQGVSYTETEVKSVYDFLLRGRRLVLVAEFHGYDQSSVVHNELLDTMKVEARFQQKTVDANCSHFATEIADHRLTRGIERYGYAATNTILGGTPLVGHDEGALVAFDRPGKGGPPNGEVVMFADSNPFVDECSDVDSSDWVLAMAR